MRHNTSVRQMTMRATSSPNKLHHDAWGHGRPWVERVAPASCPGGCTSANAMPPVAARKERECAHLDDGMPHLLAPAPGRGAWGLHVFGARGQGGIAMDVCVCVYLLLVHGCGLGASAMRSRGL